MRGSGEDSQFYSFNLVCWKCDSDFLAEFEAEWPSADIEWICEAQIQTPRWAFWRSKTCGYSNIQEVQL